MAVPNPPTNVVATAGNRRAAVTFTPPEDDGGAIITLYTVTAVDETNPGNGGQTASAQNPPIVITGLTEDEDYHFTVTATNTDGESDPSADSNSVTILQPREPDPPTAVGGLPGDGQVTVSFLPPADNGGDTITAYEATAIDETNPGNGGQTASGASSPLVVTGLTNDDGYTFTVTATNSVGESAASAKSSLVIPYAVDGSGSQPPPFANGADFELEKEINHIQLIDEIAAAAGQTVNASVTGSYDSTQPISPTNPATLWVAPDSISSSIVTDTLAAHVPNPAYGMSNADLQFQAALQKVLSDPNATLTADELQAAVRGLLVRSTYLS